LLELDKQRGRESRFHDPIRRLVCLSSDVVANEDMLVRCGFDSHRSLHRVRWKAGATFSSLEKGLKYAKLIGQEDGDSLPPETAATWQTT
jgi:hypothetical protein